MPAFTTRDPVLPEFWSERFEQGFMPWDRAGVPQQLLQFVEAAAMPLVTLVPGCGIGHEVAFLADAGWDVTGIDFSETAVAAAHAVLGRHASRVLHGDFFTCLPPQPLQLIYERAFLCALPRAMWPQVIDRYAALLPSGALLAGYFFSTTCRKGRRSAPTGHSSRRCCSRRLQWSMTRQWPIRCRHSPGANAGRSGSGAEPAEPARHSQMRRQSPLSARLQHRCTTAPPPLHHRSTTAPQTRDADP